MRRWKGRRRVSPPPPPPPEDSLVFTRQDYYTGLPSHNTTPANGQTPLLMWRRKKPIENQTRYAMTPVVVWKHVTGLNLKQKKGERSKRTGGSSSYDKRWREGEKKVERQKEQRDRIYDLLLTIRTLLRLLWRHLKSAAWKKRKEKWATFLKSSQLYEFHAAWKSNLQLFQRGMQAAKSAIHNEPPPLSLLPLLFPTG